MCFFLETHNGECGFGGYFYDQDRGSWSKCLKGVGMLHQLSKLLTQVIQNLFQRGTQNSGVRRRKSKGEQTLLIKGVLPGLTCYPL